MPLAKIEKRLFESLRESTMFAPGRRVGVAVSGGADSVALLRLLHALQPRLGITLAVLHFDHCLRAEASEADAQFVAALAASLSVDFIGDRGDVRAAAAQHKWNLEDAGRRLRYAFFERATREGCVDCVAVAHTADDQAETVLARLIRGTGPTGLAAIHPVAGCVVRPLLDFRRQDLRDYLRGLGQPWREDATNQDLERLRARVRHRLLPLIEEEFSPRIVEHLSGLARLSHEQEIFWRALTNDCLARLAAVGPQKASIAVADLLAPLPWAATGAIDDGQPSLRALTERLIRSMYAAVRGDLCDLSAAHVDQIIRLAARSTSGRRVELPGGILVHHDFGQIVFAPAAASRLLSTQASTAPSRRKIAHDYAYSFDLPERGSAALAVPELHTRFLLKVIDWPLAQRETRMEVGALDAELLSSPLVLRNWRPGDSYRPRERRRLRKLKEMLREARVSRSERGAWPVLESNGRIVWVRGLPPAADFCARQGTRRGLLIEMGAPIEDDSSGMLAAAGFIFQ